MERVHQARYAFENLSDWVTGVDAQIITPKIEPIKIPCGSGRINLRRGSKGTNI